MVSLNLRKKSLPQHHPDVAASFGSLAAISGKRENWPDALSYARLATQALLARRGQSDSRHRSTSEIERHANFFRFHAQAAFNVGRDATLLSEAYEASQWALISDVAISMDQMALRHAKDDALLTNLLRIKQDVRGGIARLDSHLSAARADADSEAIGQITPMISTLEAQLPLLDQAIAMDFPDHAELSEPKPVSVSETQSLLKTDEALFMVLETPDIPGVRGEVFGWLVTKAEIRWVKLAATPREIAESVNVLRCGLDHSAWIGPRCFELLGTNYSEQDYAQNKPLPFDLTRAHGMYLSIFSELADLLENRHLLIVASGSLAQLPFQVLVTSKPGPMSPEAVRNGAWLARRHAITVLPAVSSLRALRRHASPSNATRPLAAFGNPLLTGADERHNPSARLARQRQQCGKRVSRRQRSFAGVSSGAMPLSRGSHVDAQQVRSLPPLPETADEICAVAHALGAFNDDVRLGSRATETALKALSESAVLRSFRILHFATHGALAGDMGGSAEPGLILTPPETPSLLDDGYLSASEIANLKLDADLVILSACNTAAGGSKGGQALSGLARAFFYAGARALLVSHWAVDSDSTVSLITNVIHTMAADNSVGRSEALRRSMLALIEKGRPHEAHPAYWAPFVVVGEGANTR